MIDGDACIGIAQWSGGDGVGVSIVWRWFNNVWLEQGVARKIWDWITSSFLLEGFQILASPSNKKENLCDWGEKTVI